MKDPGNTRSRAKNIGVLNRRRRFNDTVTSRDSSDFYRFSLRSGSRVNVALRRLKNDADLALFNQRGRRIAFSNKNGKKNESIRRRLGPGTYFIEVSRERGRTSYQLRMVGRPLNPTSQPQPRPRPSSIIPLTATYRLTATGTTFSGNTSFPTANTTYTPAERFSLPGSLTVSSTRPAQNSSTTERNERDIGLFIGADPSLIPAGTLRYGTHTYTHAFWGGRTTGRPALDTAIVNINAANGTLVAQVDPTWSRNDTSNVFSWRSSLISAPKQILAGGISNLRFSNNGRTVTGTANFFGNGIIEPGAFAYSVQFSGTRVS